MNSVAYRYPQLRLSEHVSYTHIKDGINIWYKRWQQKKETTQTNDTEAWSILKSAHWLRRSEIPLLLSKTKINYLFTIRRQRVPSWAICSSPYSHTLLYYDYMEGSNSWETSNHSTIQEIFRFAWMLKRAYYFSWTHLYCRSIYVHVLQVIFFPQGFQINFPYVLLDASVV
jgi:hypothetical protein